MKKTTYTPHSGIPFTADDLLPCPFCGGIPELKFIGNEYTKSRTAEIKCNNCRATILNSTIHQDSVTVANWTINMWNNRLTD